MTEIVEITIAGLAIMSGGLLKGIVGIGAPLIAVPVLATVYDVPTAIAVMTFPLLVSSFWQAWVNRHAPLARKTLYLLLGGCVAGVALGTYLLGIAQEAWLDITLAALVLAYVAVHLANPDIFISARAACRSAFPVGLLTGIFQGTDGVSTPISVTFVHAQRLEREPFLLETQSIFTVMAASQIVALSAFGIMTPRLAIASFAGIIPIMVGMELGQQIAKHVSNSTFERLTLLVLSLIAVSLLAKASLKIAV